MFIKNFYIQILFPSVYFRGCKYINFLYKNKYILFIFKFIVLLPLSTHLLMQLLNKHFFLLLCIFLMLVTHSNSLYAQQIHLKVKGASEKESTYLKQHLTDSVFMTGQDAENSLNQLQKLLETKGFLHQQITATQRKDSLYIVQFDLGKKTDSIKIHFKEHIELLQELLNTEQTFQIIPVENTEKHLQNIVEKLAQKGYSISTAKLTNHQFHQNILHTHCQLYS